MATPEMEALPSDGPDLLQGDPPLATHVALPSPNVGARAKKTGRASSLITLAGAVLAIAIFGVMAFEYRWISDDGMIVVREVRQILAGNGPNYNPFQRDEVDTSPLWTWLVILVAFIFRGDIAIDAVVFGWVLAVAGLALALVGSAALHRQFGATRVLLPAGALIPVAVCGFWVFATSGLESGLSMFWLGLVWWLLVSVTESSSRTRLTSVALVVGLGPLVRPDFALATGVFGVALLLIVRPGWRSAFFYVGIAAGLPVAYQIFRMGYYGIGVPMPALAKEAGSSLWGRGTGYLTDFVKTYLLWIPLPLIAIVSGRLLKRAAVDRRRAILVVAPTLSGLFLGLYVVKVGGDYMHARMWIPPTFALLLPAMMLPIGRGRRAESISVVVLAVWALVAATSLRTSYHGQDFDPHGIVNERDFEVIHYAGDPDLTTTDSRTRNLTELSTLVSLFQRGDRPLVVRSGGRTPWVMPMSPAIPDKLGLVYDNLGVAAAVVPLDGTVIDVNGLASPVSGHLFLEERRRPGHEKWLPIAWALGEYADPAAIETMTDTKQVTKAQALAARRALTCGGLKELMDSVDEPMSVGRFWHNLTGSLSRTSLRIPADPFVAEHQFCGQ
jgi:arabinofuranosyltransferase